MGRFTPAVRSCRIALAPPGGYEHSTTKSAVVAALILLIWPAIDGSLFWNVSLPTIVPAPATLFQAVSNSAHSDFEYWMLVSSSRYGWRRFWLAKASWAIVTDSVGVPWYTLKCSGPRPRSANSGAPAPLIDTLLARLA